MKKYFSSLFLVILAMLMVVGMTGCSNDANKDEIRLAVYETRYNGDLMSNYPVRIFTDDTVINKLLAGTGKEPLELVDGVAVLYKLKYMNADG